MSRALVWLLALCACGGPQTSQGPASAEGAVEIVILYTSDEHGWIEPRIGEGVRQGGVAQLLELLEKTEKHCAGAMPGKPLPDCSDSSTLLLSGGDNYTGPAISTVYEGESMATAMRRLGYRASAFGNHELDFGADRFMRNRDRSGISYLAANVHKKDGADTEWVEPFVIVERRGVKLGIVGLATVTTPQTASPHRFEGVVFEDPAEALARTVPIVWKAGVDAVLVIAHECHDIIEPVVRAYPEWRLSFVGTGHCHRTSVEVVNGAPVIGPDWRLDHYARVHLKIDRSQPQRERAKVIHYELVHVASPSNAPLPSADAELDRAIAEWHARVERELGEVIGFSKSGFDKHAPMLSAWITGAWRAHFKADVAITSRGALRQEVLPGKITAATVASVLPFENELVVCEIPGAALVEILGHPEALFSGVSRKDKTWVDSDGKPIDEARRYRLVTTDFLFYGGDGFRIREYDPNPNMTGIGWREPVIEWTRAAGSTVARPLESLVDGK